MGALGSFFLLWPGLMTPLENRRWSAVVATTIKAEDIQEHIFLDPRNSNSRVPNATRVLPSLAPSAANAGRNKLGSWRFLKNGFLSFLG